jgi:hypothetical protein
MTRPVMRGTAKDVAAVSDYEQGSPCDHSGCEAAEQGSTRFGRQMEEVDGYQIEMIIRGFPVHEVLVHPVDTPGNLRACSCCISGGTGESHGGDVDRRDLPTAPGQPDRVGALPGANVEGCSGRECVDLDNQVVIGTAAPDRRPSVVERIPECLVELFGHERLLLRSGNG